MTDSRTNHWVKSNLAALGSAAVFTVYAAGFARTKDAADRLAEESDRRRPPMRPAANVAIGEVAGAPMARPDAVEPAASAPAGGQMTAAASDKTPQGAKANASPSAADRAPAPQTTAPAPAAAAGTTSSPATAANTPSPSPAPVVTPSASTPSAPAAVPDVGTVAAPAPVAASVAVAPVTAPATPPAPAAPTSPAPAKAAEPAPAKPSTSGYKDGVYAGWGTSRHGDIQAYVEIKGGKIASAFISECLTQYSCSWISKLPPQVAERQSPEVDYISGATQSSNAFYYAVVDALKKAK